MTKDHETDTDDLVERLEDSKGWPNLGKAAAARIRELEAELQAAVAAEREACENIAKRFDDASSCMSCADTMHILEAIRARGNTDAAITEMVGVRVKPLDWEYHPAGKIAAPPTGHAYIIDTRMKGRVYSIKGFNPQREFTSMDEAKAAAQADYEHRVLSALIPADQEEKLND